MKQELISRRQLSERLVEFGWMPNSPVLDLGEDFIVHVYLNDRATGVTFHIQEKSVTDLYSRRNASGDCLIHRFEVKDLKHWEGFDSPVIVLMVWDIKLREGRWILIDEAISDLDRRLPNWRNNVTKTSVHIPWENTTDNTGLSELKRKIGHRWYPIIAKDREVEMKVTLRFPDTKEGKTSREAYERFIKEGSEATFSGHTIQTLEFSDWWGKWFGDYCPDKVQLVVNNAGSSNNIPVSLSIFGANGSTVSLPNIELRNIQSGTEVIRASNTHQIKYPLHFNFKFTDPRKCNKCKISFRLNNWGNDAYEALNVLKFLRAIESGGRLTITLLNHDDKKLSFSVPSQPQTFHSDAVQLFERICRIQDKSGHIIKVPKREITHEDTEIINELIQIFEHGYIKTKHKTATITGDREMLEEMTENFDSECNPISFKMLYSESFSELFGHKIETGQMSKTVFGKVEKSSDNIRKLLSELQEGESTKIEIIDVEIIEEFPDIIER